MTREYIRPDLTQAMLAELIPPNTRVLINPDRSDLAKALKEVQHRCRKNLLPAIGLKDMYDKSLEPGFVSMSRMTAEFVPGSYVYELQSTQAAACRISDGLTGFVIRRDATQAGNYVDPLIQAVPPGNEAHYDPMKWFENLMLLFWPFLKDEEIESVEQDCVIDAMVLALERREAKQKVRDERAAKLRADMLSLYRGREPEYAAQLTDKCLDICDEVMAEGRDAIPWREMKKKWPAICDKYGNDLVPLLEDGRMQVDALRNLRGQKDFGLTLGVWKGSQRIFFAPQIVFRINAKKLIKAVAGKSDGRGSIAAEVIRINSACRLHPARGCDVGWLRVHVDDGNKLAFVDEVQSDVLEKLIFDQGATLDLGRLLKSWNLHGFASVRRWAKSIGYRAAIHSKVSFQRKGGATKSERKWNVYYASIIKQFGLVEENFEMYRAPIMVEKR